MIMAWHRSNQTSKRLNCIPGVGPLLATALVASVADTIGLSAAKLAPTLLT
jgi:transposase